MLLLLHRWDTTSLSETPSGSGEPSPSDDAPTCEELLRQHEQQQAAAPLPRFGKAVTAQQQQQQHEVGALVLLQDEQEGLRELQLGLRVMPGTDAKGAANTSVVLFRSGGGTLAAPHLFGSDRQWAKLGSLWLAAVGTALNCPAGT